MPDQQPIVCSRGGKQPTEQDLETIAAFGEELERRARKPVPTMVNGEPNPTGTGRYCLAVCYCGTCAHWKPAPVPDYSKIPGSSTYRGDREQRGSSSWDDRKDQTWIDQL